jgi:hypothetical protein
MVSALSVFPKQNAMHGFGPNSNNRVTRRQPSIPWGYDTAGRPVFEVEQLPEMSVLEKVVIGADHIELNGWIFPYKRMNRGFLQWLQGTLTASAKSTPDPSHRQWIEEMFETFQRRISGEF